MTTLVLRAVTIAFPREILAGISRLATLFSLFARAVEAAKTWETLSAMNDGQLAKRGLARRDIPNVVRGLLETRPR